jgi:fumarate hydratase subunit beta
MVQMLESGAELPFRLKGALIFYAGASPAPPGRIIGSIGPTTSARMDPFTPALLKAGLGGMIGKGPRSPSVNRAIARHRAVYFGAVGGLGALLSLKVRRAELVAFADLGPEAVYRLELEGFPVRVLTDSRGEDYFSWRG